MRLVSAVTNRGGEAAYRAEGHNRFTVRQTPRPIEQTARLCGMDYPPPFVVHGTHRLDAEGIARAAGEYALFLTALRDDRVDFETARELPRVNADLAGVLRPEPVAREAAMHGEGFFSQAFVYLNPRPCLRPRGERASASAPSSATSSPASRSARSAPTSWARRARTSCASPSSAWS